MKDYEVLVALQSLAARIGDGHTFIAATEHYHKFPLEVFWFGNQLRVIRAAADYRQALGAKIIQIGSLDLHEVQARLQPLIPQGENDWYVLNHSAELITEAEPLAALHVVPDIGPCGIHADALKICPRTPDRGDSLRTCAFWPNKQDRFDHVRVFDHTQFVSALTRLCLPRLGFSGVISLVTEMQRLRCL